MKGTHIVVIEDVGGPHTRTIKNPLYSRVYKLNCLYLTASKKMRTLVLTNHKELNSANRPDEL